jgi:hypothetical protein
MRTFFQAVRQKLCARQLYFMQLLMNLPSWPANDIDAWLPDSVLDNCVANRN